MQTAEGDQASLIALDPRSAHKTHVYTFKKMPRTALTAFSRTERVYYYLVQSSRDIQRLQLVSHGRDAPQVDVCKVLFPRSRR